MPMRITGMNSGLDTESIISELVKVKSNKKDTLVKQQTKLNWKMDAWKGLNSKIYNLYSKTISDMRFSSAYSKKKTTVSNSNVASVVADGEAVNGVQTLKVNSLAKSGYLTGAELKGDDGEKADYKNSTKLSDIAGMGDGNISLTLKTGDKSTDINLSGSSSIADVVKQLKDAGVNASFDEKNQRFFISATTTGKDADFSLTANNANGYQAMSALGINVMDDATKKEYTRLSNMTDEQKAAYIDAETQKRATAANKTIEDADKTIEEKKKAFDEFFEKTSDPYYIKSEMDSKEKIDAQLEMLKTAKETLSAVPDGETEDQKKAREEQLKTVEEQMKNLNTVSGYLTDIEKAQTSKTDAEEYLANDNAKIREEVTASLDSKIAMANNALATGANSSGATRIMGQDASIELNGATFNSNSNTFAINGLTITAQQVSTEEVTLTTANDYDGVYDTIKNFLKGYNELVNEMDKLYNAGSTKGYEPLTSDEKKEMSEDEIKEWETKIKDSLLRRDNTVGDITTAMADAMNTGFQVNGKTLYLSSFGINTLSYFSAAENEKHAYHIDGDKDDDATSGNNDVLRNMIASEPETVTKFFQQLSANLYDTLTKKMAGTSMSSLYKVYNDKQMQSDYDSYKTKIAEAEEKLKAFEDKWYSKFGAMETALAKMQSKTNALSGLLGSNG